MINQTRTLLVVALLAVAYLLWQAWQHDYPSTPPPAPAQVATSSAPAADEAAVPTPPASVAPAPASAPAVATPPPEATLPDADNQSLFRAPQFGLQGDRDVQE